MQPVFLSRDDLVRAGVPTDHLGRRGQFTKLMHDVYVKNGAHITLGTRVDAALRQAPLGAVVAGPTAAMLWGGIVPNSETLHFNVPLGTRWRPRGITIHRRQSVPWVRRGGRPVAPLEVTFVELAEMLQLVELVIFGDSMLRGSNGDGTDFVEYATSARGRGTVRARKAASLVRARVASKMETMTRLLIVFGGLPKPVVNYEIWENGYLKYRLDLAFPEWKVYVEYDGSYHGRTADQVQKDHVRREWLIRHGWKPVTLGALDVYNKPGEVLHRVPRHWSRRARGCRSAASSGSGTSRAGIDRPAGSPPEPGHSTQPGNPRSPNPARDRTVDAHREPAIAVPPPETGQSTHIGSP